MIDYIYTAMWFICGILLVFRLGKEKKIFIFSGISLASIGVWWGINIYTKECININLFKDTPWMVIFRVYILVLIIILSISWYLTMKNEKKNGSKI